MKKPYFAIHELSLIGIFAAVTAILAQIAIPLPFTPVPITLGNMAIYITGIILSPRCAFFALITYLLLGSIGIPVFTNAKSGLGVLFGPTGGYLISYPIMAAAISFFVALCERQNAINDFRKYILVFLVLIFLQIFSYFTGTLWLSTVLDVSFSKGLAMAVYPFVIIDMIKMIVCVICILPMRRRLLRLNLIS